MSYAAANRIIETAAAGDRRLRVADWAAFTSANPGVLAGDGVHPSPEGYRQRAQMYAQAADLPVTALHPNPIRHAEMR